MIKTLRARVTLWYLAFFSLLFLLFSLFLHSVVARAFERRLDESLSVQANTAAALLTDEFGEMKGDAAVASREVLGDLRFERQHGGVSGWRAGCGGERARSAGGVGVHRATRRRQSAADCRRAQGRPEWCTCSAGRVTLGGQEYLVVALQPLDELAADLACYGESCCWRYAGDRAGRHRRVLADEA
ncbi:MAG: hypothetical protein WDO73_24435 [Ignavibacteriota bacterium]